MTASTRREALAVVCVLASCAAAAGAPVLGVWPALGGVAIVLGAATLALERGAILPLLRPSVRLILIGGGTGAVLAAATYVVHPLLCRLDPSVALETAHLYNAFSTRTMAVALLALVPIIVGEELTWRGVVQTALVDRAGARAGVALAAGAYALVLVPIGSGVLVLAALACGLTWGILRVVTRSLVPALLAHLVWDLVVMLWWPLGG